jgi:hypothetical protein
MNKTVASTPLLVGRQEGIAKEYAKLWQLPQKDIQTIIDGYNALGLAPLQDIAEVSELIHNFETLIFHKMTGGGISVQSVDGATLQLNVKGAMDMLTKPRGYEELKQLVLAYPARCKAGYQLSAVGYRIVLKSADMVAKFTLSDGVLSCSPALQAQLADAGNVYIHTQRGQAIYRFLKKVAAAAAEEDIYTHLQLINYRRTQSHAIPAQTLHDLLSTYVRSYDLSEALPQLPLTNSYPNPRIPFDQDI